MTTILQMKNKHHLWYRKYYNKLLSYWSGRRDSNSRHSRWQRDALPLSYARLSYLLFNLLFNITLYKNCVNMLIFVYPKSNECSDVCVTDETIHRPVKKRLIKRSCINNLHFHELRHEAISRFIKRANYSRSRFH